MNKEIQYNPLTGKLIWLKDKGPNAKQGQEAGVTRSDGYIQIEFKRKKYLAHRLAWLLHYGKLPVQLDHINGVRADNRLDNLREVTSRENSLNRKVHRDGKLAGCYHHKPSNMWQARTMKSGVRVSFGYYKTEQEAHDAYIKGITK